jgi:hypothetical protein
MKIRQEKRDKIVSQALQEIQFARTYKQGIIWKWQKNEDMYYGRKNGAEKREDREIGSQANAESKANVDLGKMQSHVHTILSKIDNPLTFKFKRGSVADLKKTKLVNAIKEKDSNVGDWNWKDLAGKQQAVLYGRAIYSYHASSDKGYRSHLENVDVYDFLIDPSAGGLDLDNAMYLGRYGIRKNKQQLQEGLKNGIYIKTEVAKLLDGAGNLANETTQEESNKQNRYSHIGTQPNRTREDTNVYKFWEWYTTYEGQRYYLLLTEDGGCAVRVEKLTDLFKEDEILGDAPYPFWSWACFPNLTEFWTPSYADYVREIFMAQAVSINQMLDNAEKINKPQRAVDTSTIESISDLIYRKNGIIRFKSGTDVNRAFQIVQTPSINTPLQVYDKLEQIQSIESGVTSDAKGASDQDKVGIYEGNLAQVADRFGLLNKSYSQGYKRFAKLYWYGIEDHLTKKVSVKILGSKGLEKTVFVGRRDIKPKSEYEVIVESTSAEAQSDNIDKKNKINFLAQYKGNPLVNQKILFEKEAEIVGMTDDDVRSLLDVQGDGTAEIISEAERDILSILDGKVIEPNMNANIAYANYFIEYLKDHQEDMSEDTFLLFQDYLNRIEKTIINNMGTQLTNQLAKQGQLQGGGAPAIESTEEIPEAPVNEPII